eukprot:91433_1
MAVGFVNGRVQIMRNDTDDDRIVVETGIDAKHIRWNSNGTVLAVAGSRTATAQGGAQKTYQIVQFYNPYGKHVRTLRVPGNILSALSWEGGSLRLALAVDSHIYFANIRPDYKWGFFADTLVYSYSKPERE